MGHSKACNPIYLVAVRDNLRRQARKKDAAGEKTAVDCGLDVGILERWVWRYGTRL